MAELMRLYISKKHHRKLLSDLAAQMGSDNPSDALEHILNCWIVLPPSSSPPAAIGGELPPPVDDFSGLVQF
jgi:hypothetical protein